MLRHGLEVLIDRIHAAILADGECGDECVVPWQGDARGAKRGIVGGCLAPEFLVVGQVGEYLETGLDAGTLVGACSSEKFHLYGAAKGGLQLFNERFHRQLDCGVAVSPEEFNPRTGIDYDHGLFA